jgi:hypothetical protein
MLAQQVDAQLMRPPIAVLGSPAGEGVSGVPGKRAFGFSCHLCSFLSGPRAIITENAVKAVACPDG